MKKKILLALGVFALTSTTFGQSISNGDFDNSTATGFIGDPGVGAPWVKGCERNTLISPQVNNPMINEQNGNYFLELRGNYEASQGGIPVHDLESVEQNVGAIPSGTYTITFDAKQAVTWGYNDLKLVVKLKNYERCTYTLPQHPSPEEIASTITIPNGSSYNNYSITFCVPDHLHNELSILEIATMNHVGGQVSSDGIISIDNVEMTSVSPSNYLDFDYKIDCLTGIVKVKPTSTLNPAFYDMFILMENNPNDPNNQSDAGDIVHDEIAWWGYTIDAQGWYTFNTPIDPSKNYYIKRGIWGDCQSWVELRKFNVEMTADQFDPSFTFEINCNEKLEPKLTVTGADQLGKNPHHMFILVEYFPGTNQQEQQIESFSWWQQSNASNYQYQQGPFTFNHTLDPNKHYYVKRGVWDACTPWQESRRYDIDPQVCDPNDICDMYITALQPPCFDGCGTGKWLSEFQINPNSTCYNAIDYVVFNTVNNHPFGPTFTDNTAPYTVPYCTSGNYYVTATIHYLNGTTSTASYYQPACFDDPYIRKSTGEQNVTSEEITLYPNPATSTLTIETGQSFDELHVYSIGGKLIDTYQERTIDVSHLENGYYLVKLVKDGNVLSTKRFTKQ